MFALGVGALTPSELGSAPSMRSVASTLESQSEVLATASLLVKAKLATAFSGEMLWFDLELVDIFLVGLSPGTMLSI